MFVFLYFVYFINYLFTALYIIDAFLNALNMH